MLHGPLGWQEESTGLHILGNELDSISRADGRRVKNFHPENLICIMEYEMKSLFAKTVSHMSVTLRDQSTEHN
jgi:hypothetical protein